MATIYNRGTGLESEQPQQEEKKYYLIYNPNETQSGKKFKVLDSPEDYVEGLPFEQQKGYYY